MTTHPSTQSHPPSRKLQRALVYYAAFILLGMVASATGPTLPNLAEQTGSTLGQISIIFTGTSLGYIFGSLLGGWLYDRREGHPVMAVILAALALVLFSIPLVPMRWLLLIVVLLVGFAMGILDVGGNALIVWLFGRKVSPYMNALHLAFGLGAFLSPLLVDRVVVATGEIHWAYWTLSVMAIPIVIWLLRVPSPTQPAPQAGKNGEQPTRSYTGLIWMVMALFFMHVGTEVGYGGWIYSYASATGVGPDTIGRLLNSTYWGAFTLGRLISVPLAVRMRPRIMLLTDLVGSILSLGVILLLPGWPPAIWIGTFGLGLSIASLFPATINFAERRMPISGQVTGYFLVGGNAGAMILPWVIGQLFEPAGPISMMVLLEVAMILGLGFYFLIRRYTNK